MKNILLSCLVFISFLGINSFSQSVSFKEYPSIKFGNSEGELGKTFLLNNKHHLDFPVDDIEIDVKKNFYLCDKYSKVVLKFDSSFKLVFEKKIDDENFRGELLNIDNKVVLKELLFNIDIEADINENLYVMIKKSNYFYKILKMDKNGKLISTFKLDIPPLKDLYISFMKVTNSRIFIQTSKEFILDKSYQEYMKENVYVYDLNGKLLGRCDNCFDDYKDNIYKLNILGVEKQICVEQFVDNAHLSKTIE